MTKDEVTKLRMNSPESLQFLNNATKFYNLKMCIRDRMSVEMVQTQASEEKPQMDSKEILQESRHKELDIQCKYGRLI